MHEDQIVAWLATMVWRSLGGDSKIGTQVKTGFFIRRQCSIKSSGRFSPSLSENGETHAVCPEKFSNRRTWDSISGSYSMI